MKLHFVFEGGIDSPDEMKAAEVIHIERHNGFFVARSNLFGCVLCDDSLATLVQKLQAVLPLLEKINNSDEKDFDVQC